MITLVVLLFSVASMVLADTDFESGPEIETTGGIVRGTTSSCEILFCTYFDFRGIPYAKAPVGDLRFRAPLPHPGWEGVLDASQHGANCPSASILGGLNYNEDCLFLNIYTKSLTDNLPVMVWIHGGSFQSGSGNSLVYGPDYLVDEDVMVVTINYRLGALGFLSTGDSNAPGNYGLKDAVLALKWIQANIARFGGDPTTVTIFGESAGGALVHYLILSPSAKGLFHRAISQSGSALNPWAYQTKPAAVAHRFGERLGLQYRDNADFVEQLRKIEWKDFVKATPGRLEYQIPRGLLPIPFVPSRDPAGIPEEEVLLPNEPIQLILSGAYNQIPYITGFNEAESLFSIHEFLVDPQLTSNYSSNPYLFIPRSWDIEPNSTEADGIIRQIRKFYFHNTSLTADMKMEYAQYNTDLMFAHGIDQTAKYHAEIQGSENPVYYYKFCFDGAMNIVKKGLLLESYPGPMHADDIFYIWKVSPIPVRLFSNNSAIVTRERMVRMWTNFARDGNPTPFIDLVTPTTWDPVNNTQQYLRIDDNITMEDQPSERLSFWSRLQSQHQRLKRL